MLQSKNRDRRIGKYYESVKRYAFLREWLNVTEDLNTDSFFQFNEPSDRFTLVQLLIKNILEHQEYLFILKELQLKNYLSKITQKSELMKYSLYNIAAFIKSCDPQFFKELIVVIH